MGQPDGARVADGKPERPVPLDRGVTGRRRSGRGDRLPDLGRQWLSQSGQGFDGSRGGPDGPSTSITTAARKAIHGP